MHTLDAPADLQIDEIPARRRSLRVAYVTETYPPEVNGVATTTAKFVEGLHRRQHDVQLVRPRQTRADEAGAGPRLHEVLMRGLPIPNYPHLRMGVPSKRALVKLWSLRRPDVVHVATEGPLGWSALQAATHLRVPVTSDFRTNFHAYSRHYGIGWLHRPIMAYLRKFHNRCACTMVPTETLKRELERAGFERLQVVQRGVDTDRYGPTRRSDELRRGWGAGPDDVVVGIVGRLAAEKNLGLVVDAFREIRRTVAAARLVFIGDGPLRADLQAGCADAVFTGNRSGLDLAAHYASLDLFLFPSLTETFGNVTVEALASGLPVVAYDHAAAGQLIRSGTNGLLCTPGDTAGFIEAAIELAERAPLRAAIAAQARATALGLGWDAVVARFEQHLADATAQALPARPLYALRRTRPAA
ncbi:MAG: glycosyltransferase family 1 protein [Rubrivivax sp.]|nr:glycosyltransferase family 1 protein [Rubrivivax sp.]